MLTEMVPPIMSDDQTKSDLRKRLAPMGQDHLLRFWDELSPEDREELGKQVRSLDLTTLSRLLCDRDSLALEIDRAKIEPPNAIAIDTTSPEQRNEARSAGQAALRQGKVGMILVAGGQGTRLGFDHPKGMYPIGPLSNRSLFQIHVDRLKVLMDRYQTSIPLYLMTSPATDRETRDYLDSHHRFGLREEELMIFCQGVMPAVDANRGRILMESKSRLALSPDGHGGLIAAMERQGCFHHARGRGIELFFYGQVDNPLLPLCDPTLLGFHLLTRSEMTTQVVRKRFAKEKVGNVVSIEGRTQIIEYSDLPDALAERINPDGSLVYWAGNIAVHVFDLAFLERSAHQADALPFHQAIKKVPFVDDEGNLVQPSLPNAIKFERFVFDLLPHARNAIVVEARGDEVFAPVKNPPGDPIDSPDTSRRAIIRLHQQWLRKAGALVDDDTTVEIHPAWALDETEVVTKIVPDQRVDRPTYFSP